MANAHGTFSLFDIIQLCSGFESSCLRVYHTQWLSAHSLRPGVHPHWVGWGDFLGGVSHGRGLGAVAKNKRVNGETGTAKEGRVKVPLAPG